MAPVIDFHVHIFPDPLAPAAMARLQELGGGARAYYDGTLAGLRHSMAASGVQLAVIQPVSTKPAQVRTINAWVAELNRLEDIRAFGTLHPGMLPAEWRAEIDFLKQHAILGVKMHPEYQGFYPDDPRLADLYAGLEQANLMLLLHAGVDLSYPGSIKATPQRIREVHKSYPRLKMILAHLGGYRQWEDVGKYLVNEPLWLDTAYCLGEIPDPAAQEILHQHPSGYILFASDGPWGSPARHLQNLRKIQLPAQAELAIEGRNAAQLLQLSI